MFEWLLSLDIGLETWVYTGRDGVWCTSPFISKRKWPTPGTPTSICAKFVAHVDDELWNEK
ncbi:hypothetical protein GCM10009000_061000 [Halobacterium noricense]|uniref:Transposase n=1 Tax=Haladaptatus pallidirubidus TaxID=1008152 RepID=A0AAV3UJ19_9EURY